MTDDPRIVAMSHAVACVTVSRDQAAAIADGDARRAAKQTALLTQVMADAVDAVGWPLLTGSLNGLAAGLLVIADRAGLDGDAILQECGARVARRLST